MYYNMNQIEIKYVLDDGQVVYKRGVYDLKLHYLDLNKMIISECPIDTDYIKSVMIKIIKDVE